MKRRRSFALSLVAYVLVAGCAKTTVSNQHAEFPGRRMSRPGNVVVYDFSATVDDAPADAALKGEQAPMTASQIAEGRRLGAEIANELVANIRAMGMPAATAASGATPEVGDLVIKGYFLSIQQGNAAERVLIGFGSGGAELRTAVEGYVMTANGLVKVASGDVESDPGKTPGTAFPAAAMVATHNPIGLIVTGGLKVAGEVSGKTTIDGRAKQTADEIAKNLKPRFERQGWIPSTS
jgi:uncharacterized protein DUF4410